MDPKIIFACSIAVVIIYVLISHFSGKKTPEEIERDKRLEDDTIMVNGKSVTLEQAENEIFVLEDEGILSVEEIERRYHDDEKEIQLINRDFQLLNSWANYEEVELLLDRAPQFDEYEQFYATQLCAYKPNFIIGLVSVTYNYRGQITEEQSLFIVKGITDLRRFDSIEEIIVDLVDDNVIIRQPKKATHKGFRQLVMEIEKLI
jgi:hypothetical protein